MHATHIDPRRILIAAMASLVLALVAVALLNALGNLNLSTAGDSQPVSAPPWTSAAAPAWLENPISSPLVALRTTP